MPPSYRPALDGLRALAVAVVLVFHIAPGVLPGGFVGVDVFFVLSGYLITGLLLDEFDRTGRLSLGQFYARRIRRLLPAALITIAGVCVATMILANGLERRQVAGDVLPAALAWSNWHFLDGATDYFAPDRSLNPFSHFWSLAVEEQFYLVWPTLTWALIALSRRLGRRVVTIAVAAASAGVVVWWWTVTADDPLRAYYATWFRGGQLGVGAALAWAGLLTHPRRRKGAVLGVAGTAGVLAIAALFPAGSAYPGIWGPAVTLASAGALAGMEWGPQQRLNRWASSAPAVWVGLRSYAIYLWHIPVAAFAPRGADRWGLAWLANRVVWVALTLALADLSYRLVESPIRRSHRLRQIRAGALIPLGLALFVAGAAAGSALLHIEGTVQVGDLDTTEVLAASQERPVTYPSGCHGGQESGWTGRVCVRRAAPGRPRIAVLGDSHGASWDGAVFGVASSADLEYRYATFSACPPIDLAWLDATQSSGCRQFRETVIPELAELTVGDVVVVEFAWARILEAVDGSGRRRDERVAELRSAIRSSAEELARNGATVVVMGPIPTLPRGIPNCLAGASQLSECVFVLGATSPAEALADEVLAPLARSGQIERLSVDELVCPGRTCRGLSEDGLITYRDKEHLTNGYSTSLSSPLAEALTAAHAQE